MLLPLRSVGLIVVLGGVLWCGAAHAQVGGGLGDGGITGLSGMSLVRLAQIPSVQNDINLGGESLAKVKDLYKSEKAERIAEMQRVGLPTGPTGFRDVKTEDRTRLTEKITAVKRALNEKFVPQLKDVLSPAQFERMRQIQLQLDGSQALLTDPDIRETLDITKEQAEKITAINEEYRSKARKLGGPAADLQEARTMRQQLQNHRDSKAADVLSMDQQEKYAKLKGRPFDMNLIP